MRRFTLVWKLCLLVLCCISWFFTFLMSVPSHKGAHRDIFPYFSALKQKTSFLLDILPVLNYHNNETSELKKKKKQLSKKQNGNLSFFHFIFLHLVQVLCISYRSCLKSIPFHLFKWGHYFGVDSGDHLWLRIICCLGIIFSRRSPVVLYKSLCPTQVHNFVRVCPKLAWNSDDYFELFPPLSNIWIDRLLKLSSDVTTGKLGSDFDCPNICIIMYNYDKF